MTLFQVQTQSSSKLMAKPKDNRDLYKLAYEDNYYERTDTYSKGKSKPKKKKSVKKSYKDFDRFDRDW